MRCILHSSLCIRYDIPFNVTSEFILFYMRRVFFSYVWKIAYAAQSIENTMEYEFKISIMVGLVLYLFCLKIQKKFLQDLCVNVSVCERERKI